MGEFTYHPIYKEVEKKNTVICGVNHVTDPDEDKNERKKFFECIAECDHLLFETNGRAGNTSLRNYESLAFSINRKNSRFLEKGFNPPEIYSMYGVPEKIALFYETMTATMFALHQNQRADVNTIISYYHSVYLLDRQQTNKLNQQWGNFIEFCNRTGNVNAVSQIGILFDNFSRGVRDYEIIGPTAQTLIRELDGRKGIVIGSLHLNFLYDYLMGREMSAPRSWTHAISESPLETQTTIRELESVI